MQFIVLHKVRICVSYLLNHLLNYLKATEKANALSRYRRNYERFVVNDSASLVTDNSIERPLILEDLSARGASVIGDYPFQINEKVTVVIYIPFFLDSPAFKQAKTVWCKKIDRNLWQAGLDFGIDNLINLTPGLQNS